MDSKKAYKLKIKKDIYDMTGAMCDRGLVVYSSQIGYQCQDNYYDLYNKYINVGNTYDLQCQPCNYNSNINCISYDNGTMSR